MAADPNPNRLDRLRARHRTPARFGGGGRAARHRRRGHVAPRQDRAHHPERATQRPSHVAPTLLPRHALLGLANAADELYRAGCFQAALLQGRAMEAHMRQLYILGARNPHTQNPLNPKDVNAVYPSRGRRPAGSVALREVQDRHGTA